MFFMAKDLPQYCEFEDIFDFISSVNRGEYVRKSSGEGLNFRIVVDDKIYAKDRGFVLSLAKKHKQFFDKKILLFGELERVELSDDINLISLDNFGIEHVIGDAMPKESGSRFLYLSSGFFSVMKRDNQGDVVGTEEMYLSADSVLKRSLIDYKNQLLRSYLKEGVMEVEVAPQTEIGLRLAEALNDYEERKKGCCNVL